MKNIKPNEVGIFEKMNLDENEMFGVSLGNGSQFPIILNYIDEYLWVSVVGKGCYGFAGFAYWGYVNGKLNIGNESDARHMADFINDQLDLGEDRQGTYREGRTFMEPAFVNN